MIISTFESVMKAYVQAELNVTWDEAIALLSTPWPADSKEDVQMFNLGRFKKITDPTVQNARKYHYVDNVRQPTWDAIPNTVRRCKANLISISGIVLDVDNNMTIMETIEKYSKYEFLLYSTFNNLIPNKLGQIHEKFRVVIPFTRPLLAEDIVGREESIRALFPGVDASCFTMSQSFYFHSGTEAVVYHNPGQVIDPYDDFDYIEPVKYVASTNTHSIEPEKFAQYKERVIASLKTCSNLRYARGLILVSLCRSIGASESEFNDLCLGMAGSDSSIQRDDVRAQLWNSWEGDKLIAGKRDAFIKEHGGVPLSRRVSPDSTQDELMMIKRISEILESKK